MSAGNKQQKKPRILVKILWRLALGVLLAAVLLAAVFGYLIMRGNIDAPDWVRDRVEAGIARTVPDGSLDFDDLQFRIEADGHPVLRLRNAVLKDAEGARVIELSEMHAVLSLTELLKGRFAPVDLVLAGVFVDVTRAPNGEIELNFDQGEQISTVSGAGLAGALIRTLERPSLARLHTVEVEAVTLTYDDQRVLRSWTIDGGRLRMAVTDEAVDVSGDLALLSGRASVATVEANLSLERSNSAFAFGVSVAEMPAVDLATQLASLGWLSVLDAPISGSIRGGGDDQGQLLPIAVALKIGEGSVKPNDATQGVPFRSAGSYFSYDPDTQVLAFDEISVDSDWLIGRSDGSADLVLREDGLPEGFEARFTFTDLRSSEGGLWEKEVSFENASVEFGLQLAPFELNLHSATLGYEDARLDIKGQLNGTKQGWAYGMDGSIESLSHDQLITLWPTQRSTKARAWLEANVEGAAYSDAALSLSAKPGQKAQFAFDTGLSNAQIRYAQTMSPGENVSGRVTLADKRLEAYVASGEIVAPSGVAIDAAGTTFIIGDVTDKEETAVVKLNGQGPAKAVLEILEQIPGLAADDTDLATLGDGQARFNGGLAFPIGRKPLPSEYRYSIDGKVTDVSSDTLLRNQLVTSSELTVSASNEQIIVEGPAEIGGVGLDAVWSNSPEDGKSALSGQIEISQDFVDQFGLGLPEGTVNGQGIGQIIVDLPKGEDPTFELTSDLDGVGLDLGFVGWSKSNDAKGTLIAAGSLVDPLSIDTLRIEAPEFAADGQITLREDGSLDAVVFETMKVKDWLDAGVRIQGNRAGSAPDIYLSGGRVDVQALTEETGGIGATGSSDVQGRLYTELDTLYVSEFLSLQNLSGEFDLGQNMRGNFAGVLNEAVEVTGAISSDTEGRRVISVSADDAGKVFSALGLLDRASQGTILVELTEKSEGYSGTFVARDLRLLDMPLFAELLNAVSVVGLLDQLNFDGIAFGEVEGEFYFSEDKFILTRASATGPSIGLSLDGTYDFVNDNLDLQGTLTPIFLVNSIGGVLNRKGEGLIGFTFDVKGPADAPKIGVNPFSALAPSLFRDLFRKPAPEAPE